MRRAVVWPALLTVSAVRLGVSLCILCNYLCDLTFPIHSLQAHLPHSPAFPSHSSLASVIPFWKWAPCFAAEKLDEAAGKAGSVPSLLCRWGSCRAAQHFPAGMLQYRCLFILPFCTEINDHREHKQKVGQNDGRDCLVCFGKVIVLNVVSRLTTAQVTDRRWGSETEEGNFDTWLKLVRLSSEQICCTFAFITLSNQSPLCPLYFHHPF